MTELRSEIYKILKTYRGLTFDELCEHITTTTKRWQIQNVVGQELSKGGLTSVNGILDIAIVLNRMQPKATEYDGATIDHLLARKEVAAEERTFPDDYTSPVYAQYIQGKIKFDQGNRGICVGKELSIAKLISDIIHQLIKPKPEEYADIRYGVTESNGVIHDTGFDNHLISGEQIFRDSRRLGNITYPDGSYTKLGVRVLVEEGSCLEKQWWTSRTFMSVCVTPQPSSQVEVDETKAQHKVAGSALVTWSPQKIKAAIMDYGCLPGSIVIYENYMDGRPDHLPIGYTEIGSHSVCFVKWKKEAGQTWYGYVCTWQQAGWNEITWVPEPYMPSGFLDGFALIDDQEAEYLKSQIVKVLITSNAPAQIIINSTFVGQTPITVYLQKGTHTIKASADGYSPSETVVTVDDGTAAITIVLEALPPEPWWMKLINWLSSLWR